MYWANFLHFYQPPDQVNFILARVVYTGYRPFLNVLLKHEDTKITANISGCLLDHLAKNDQDVIDDFRKLIDRGQIELTASAKFHPFLPYIDAKQVERQIEINNESLRKYFGDNFKLTGFYSPEAAYSLELAKLVHSLGYKWTIVDEVGYSGKLSSGHYDFSHTPGFYSGGFEFSKIVGTSTAADKKKIVDYSKTYELKEIPGFHVFFRERVISDALASGQIKSADQFIDIVRPQMSDERYLFTGTDGEAYGHHQPELVKVFSELLDRKVFKTATLSELLKLFPNSEKVSPIPCSWGTSEQEIKDKNYYSRWRHPDNELHEMQWQLNHFVTDLVMEAKEKKDKNFEAAQALLDKALYSCHFWWASARPWWSIELIERGAYSLLLVVDALEDISHADRDKARDLYLKIITTAFDWLRTEKVKDLSHKHV